MRGRGGTVKTGGLLGGAGFSRPQRSGGRRAYSVGLCGGGKSRVGRGKVLCRKGRRKKTRCATRRRVLSERKTTVSGGNGTKTVSASLVCCAGSAHLVGRLSGRRGSGAGGFYLITITDKSIANVRTNKVVFGVGLKS